MTFSVAIILPLLFMVLATKTHAGVWRPNRVSYVREASASIETLRQHNGSFNIAASHQLGVSRLHADRDACKGRTDTPTADMVENYTNCRTVSSNMYFCIHVLVRGFGCLFGPACSPTVRRSWSVQVFISQKLPRGVRAHGKRLAA